MKKIFALALSALLTVSSLAACSGAPASSQPSSSETSEASAVTSEAVSSTPKDTELNLFTWEAMFPPEVLTAFTQETGIKVNYTVFDTDETMLSKLQTAKGGDYDLIVADDYIIETAINEGLVQKIDKNKVANIGSVNPIYQGQFFDKTDEYTVPYGAGVQTIVYDPSIVKTEIAGYEDLWDKELQSNLGIISNYRVINGMALKVLGESYNTPDIAKIDEAGTMLLELAPNIRLIKDDNIQNDLISGEIGAAVMYTSQVTMAMLANPNLKVVYPKEGIGFGIMAQFIPVNAPHADAAHQFMNFILKPEISKQCYEFIGYYCTNKDADALISDEYKSFLTLPAEFTKDKMEMIQNISSDAEAEHAKIWTEFKTATE